MSAMLGATVSTGFVALLANEAAGGLGGFVDEIRRRLRQAALVHVDEITHQVRSDKRWFHVVSNEFYTYLFASPTRGKSAPDEAGVLGVFSGVMVHDRLAMDFKYDQATHAICNIANCASCFLLRSNHCPGPGPGPGLVLLRGTSRPHPAIGRASSEAGCSLHQPRIRCINTEQPGDVFGASDLGRRSPAHREVANGSAPIHLAQLWMSLM